MSAVSFVGAIGVGYSARPLGASLSVSPESTLASWEAMLTAMYPGSRQGARLASWLT